MKLYIAGHNQHDARAVASLCRSEGHTITSRWLDEDLTKSANYTDVEKSSIAAIDFDDISKADALVLLSAPRRIPGGKFVEAGIAIGQGKRIYLLGHRENMLLWHWLVWAFDSAEDFLRAIRDQER